MQKSPESEPIMTPLCARHAKTHLSHLEILRPRVAGGKARPRMALNPPPRDLSSTQAVVDKESGQLRTRREEERTTAGAGIEHNKFIVCPALGVRSHKLHNAPRCFADAAARVTLQSVCTLLQRRSAKLPAPSSRSRAHHLPSSLAMRAIAQACTLCTMRTVTDDLTTDRMTSP
jgi:hypothetical protein